MELKQWIILIFLLLGFVIICKLISLLSSVIKYIDSKKKVNEVKLLNERIITTSDLNKFIMHGIEVEVTKLMNSIISLNIDYDVLNLDKDVSNISETVFKSVRIDILKNEHNIVTQDFIMQNIVDMTRSYLLSAISSVNTERAKDNMF